MKNLLLIIMFLFSNISICQEIFENEKKLDSMERYNSKEIKISKDIDLFGTLVTPKTNFTTVLIIVPGTGNVSQYGHSYLPAYLLQNNIGVFRFDKRGVGKSNGTPNYKPDVNLYASDVVNIFNTLKDLDSLASKKIGLLGHSFGGVATILSIAGGVEPDFLIQWSTPVEKPRELIEFQIQNRMNNYDYYINANSTDEKVRVLNFVHKVIDENSTKSANELLKILKKKARKAEIKKNTFVNYIIPYFVDFAKLDNTKVYKTINFPTLYIIGSNDIIVDPIKNKNSLGKIGNKYIEFKKFEHLNHFLTKFEILKLDYNLDVSAKKYIINWILTIK